MNDPKIIPPNNKRVFKSGATSTKQARLSLIPHRGLVNAAERFELGLERHKEKAYNALSNQKPLEDKEWLIERASHCIEHCYSLIDRLIGKKEMSGAKGDAGAIAWAGLVLGEAMVEIGEFDFNEYLEKG